MKVHPEAIKKLKADLDIVRHENSQVINAEPKIAKLIDDAREFTQRRYDQVNDMPFEPTSHPGEKIH